MTMLLRGGTVENSAILLRSFEHSASYFLVMCLLKRMADEVAKENQSGEGILGYYQVQS